MIDGGVCPVGHHKLERRGRATLLACGTPQPKKFSPLTLVWCMSATPTTSMLVQSQSPHVILPPNRVSIYTVASGDALPPRSRGPVAGLDSASL